MVIKITGSQKGVNKELKVKKLEEDSRPPVRGRGLKHLVRCELP